MLIPMITALGAVSAGAGGLAYAQRKRRAMIEEAVRAGQAVGALAVVRALEEGNRATGDEAKKAAIAAEAARNIGFVAVRHQVAICRAVEEGAAPHEIAAAMDGPCCMGARAARLSDADEPVNAATFRALLLHLADQMKAANQSTPEASASEFRRRLLGVITAEAAIVLAWLRFTRDARAPAFARSIETEKQRLEGAKEIHRMFRAIERQARQASGPAVGARAARDDGQRRTRRKQPGNASLARSLAEHLDRIVRAEHAATVFGADDRRRADIRQKLTREKAVWIVKYLRHQNDPAWRLMLEELGDGAALTRRARQIDNRFDALAKRFQEGA